MSMPLGRYCLRKGRQLGYGRCNAVELTPAMIGNDQSIRAHIDSSIGGVSAAPSTGISFPAILPPTVSFTLIYSPQA
jgi:hypothetical protein